MVRTAVILAAGLGSRLQGIWNGQPKGLIPVGGTSLLERSFHSLRESGIREIILGTGHEREALEALAAKYSFVKTVYSSDYATTSSFATLSKMRNILSEDVLLLESDLLYDGRAITFLQNSPGPNVILSSDVTSLGDEVFLEVDDSHHLVGLSKKRADLKQVDSVLVGINKLSKEYLKSLFAHADELLAKNPKIDYERAFVEHRGHKEIRVISYPQLAWTEIDTPEHFDHAVNNILPRINR